MRVEAKLHELAKISRGDSDRFQRVLVRQIRDYFDTRQCAPQGGKIVLLKLAVGAAWFVGSYVALLAATSPVVFSLSYVAHGGAQLFLLINIGHDANHGAMSRRGWVNGVLSRTMDLCGLSSRLWRVAHHRQHHGVVNIGTEDDALAGRGLLRLSPHRARPRMARLQHVYALPTYCAGTLDYLFVRDFALQAREPTASPFRAWAALIAAKVFYVGYMIVVPVVLTGHAAWLVLASFAMAHMVIGCGAVLLFQTTHLLPESRFPRSAEDAGGTVEHILATTADVAVDSRWLAWIAGGLHSHVIHHFMPGICHTHYPALSKIVEETARECELPYRAYPTFRSALSAHLRHLRAMGSLPSQT